MNLLIEKRCAIELREQSTTETTALIVTRKKQQNYSCMNISKEQAKQEFPCNKCKQLRHWAAECQQKIRDCNRLCEKEKVEVLLNKLKSVGFSYCVRRSKLPSAYGTKYKTNYVFQQLAGNVPISFFGPAFSVESMCNRHCTFGPKYYKEKGPVVPEHLADHIIPRKKRLRVISTKKSDCPATLDIKCVRVYPGYVIKSINEDWKTKAKVLAALRKDMDLPHKPDSYLRFYLIASPASLHTHSTECVQASGFVHPLLVKEIHNLVQNGTTSIKVIKSALDSFVSNHFTETNIPDRMNTTFYPSNKTIYAHVYRALHMMKNPIDQNTLQSQISLHEVSSDEETYAELHIPETSNSHLQQIEARKLCEQITTLAYNCNNSEKLQKVLELLRNCVQELECENPEVGLHIVVQST